MDLTKKQKQFVRKNFKKSSSPELAKHLHVEEKAINDYLEHLGAAKKETSNKDTSPDSLTLIKHPLFNPIFLTFICLIIGIICFDPKLYISGDNVELIEVGTRLAYEHHYGGHIKYPYGVPALLALSELLVPGSLMVKKIAVFILYLIMVPFLYGLFRYYVSSRASLVLTFLGATSATVIEFSHYVMTEIPYLSVSIIGLYFIHRAQKEPDNKYLFYMSFLAIVAPFYFRNIGLALFAAAVTFPILHRKWKDAGMTFVVCFLIMLPWLLR